MDFGNILRVSLDGKWALVVCDRGLDMSTDTGKLVATIVCAVAEFERERITNRTRDALAAIPRGTTHLDKDGNVKNPPGAVSTVPADVTAIAVYLHGEGKSLRQIGQALTGMGKPAPNGGSVWHPHGCQAGDSAWHPPGVSHGTQRTLIGQNTVGGGSFCCAP